MSPLPTGTLTLLFSDIEGSTSLLKGLGPRWGDALSAQRRILREAFAAHQGVEMGTEGDSFFVVFTSAQEALAAAIEAQRRLGGHDWPGGTALRVRIGLHTGEPQRHEDGYIGIDVHRAARIAATAHGGQIVVSESTQALAGHAPGLELRDLGWHRLKDLVDPEHLFDVVAPGLLEEHPQLRSLGTRANLPTYATELIGRGREVAELCATFDDEAVRLVTLTGTGGTGKTRLAVAVASELEFRLGCDIYFAALHAADRSAVMWSGIAEAVSAPGDADQLPDERVVRFLADRNAFLVLDNLEQIEQADVVVSRLLDEAPGLRILATSRRPLHLVDEHQYPVSPLAVPDPAPDAPLDSVQTGAVDLFVRRARMVKPSFALTAGNVGHVVALCRRLDGLPLAIELAAARTRLLSPKALLNRIDDRLTDSTTAGDRAERQRTLRATISWSYDLLDECDQRVFRQLGVFSSRFDLDAVGRVLGAQDRDPLDVVAHLIDFSLLEIVEGPDGEPMIFLLETIRHFARERLQESDEYDAVRLAHAHWCQEVATRISELLHGPRQTGALDRMEAVEEDIRAALDWCLAPAIDPAGERAQCGLALLQSMDAYWYRFGYVVEGRGWHDRALRLLADEDARDSATVVDALHGQGILALQQLDLATGTQALERALAMARRLGDPDREARESNSLGIARRDAGDTAGARALIERSLAIARRIGDRQREATALSNVGHTHMDCGDYVAAAEAFRRAITADKALDDPWGVAIDQTNLVTALLHAEGPERAHEEFCRVAQEVVVLDDIDLTIDLIETGAAIWAGLGDAQRAATILGAAQAQRQVAGLPRTAPDQHHLDRFIQPARNSVPPQDWSSALAGGSSLTIEEAVAQAVAGRSMSTPA
ncbi:MAG TPA: adenylate/guanylate cyclase domain-containing protein [Actinomycetota bacterium]|nr:adenylate/guanylate cyclase domain-containing protein [Actinomycetota bacterium]